MSAVRDAIIERGARALGAELDGATIARLAAWIDLVADWGRRIDLTAARSDDELVDLMIADALVLARHVASAARVVDVGTGAGAPGLGLAIVRSDLEVTLVEPKDKRVAAMRAAIGKAFAPGCRPPRVVRGRGEELAGRELFDVAVSRATLPPPEWLALGARLAPEGRVWVLLAQGEPPERPGWRPILDERYRWPLTHVARRAVLFAPAG